MQIRLVSEWGASMKQLMPPKEWYVVIVPLPLLLSHRKKAQMGGYQKLPKVKSVVHVKIVISRKKIIGICNINKRMNKEKGLSPGTKMPRYLRTRLLPRSKIQDPSSTSPPETQQGPRGPICCTQNWVQGGSALA